LPPNKTASSREHVAALQLRSGGNHAARHRIDTKTAGIGEHTAASSFLSVRYLPKRFFTTAPFPVRKLTIGDTEFTENTERNVNVMGDRGM